MHYKDVRDQVRDGDLIAYRGKSWISGVIRMATRSSYSHVGVAIWLNENLFILEAREFAGVTVRALSTTGDFVLIQHMEPSAWNRDVEDEAMSYLGRSYNYLDAVRAWLGLEMKGEGWICSKFVRQVYWQMGYMVPVEAKTPEQMVEWVQFNASHRTIAVNGLEKELEI